MRKIRIFIRDFRIGIKNLIKWFPVIWKDKDWDHEYFEDIILFKLQNMYNRFISDECPVNWEASEESIKALKALRIAITILQRKTSGFYINTWYDLPATDKAIFDLESWEERDWKIFCSILEKYEAWWWD